MEREAQDCDGVHVTVKIPLRAMSPAKSPKQGPPFLLLVVAYVCVGAAVLTLIPSSSAPMKNDLNYRSLCTFVPWSTLLLLLVAGVLAAVRNYMLTRTD